MKDKNKKSWSRREFLKTAGAAGVATLLTGTDPKPAVTATTGSWDGPLPVRPFGKTGVSVPILGFGGSQNLESKQRLLRQAAKLGATYWDTAESYADGGSEEAMGKYFVKHPEDRKKVFLVSKSDESRPSRISNSLDKSLKRLKTTYIDLYFIHGISSPGEMDDDIRDWAEKKKAEGKIRLIGFSAHTNMETCMLGAAKLGWIDGIMVTYNYRLMHTDTMKRAVEACVKAGIGLTAMKTQAGWSWWRNEGKKSRTGGSLYIWKGAYYVRMIVSDDNPQLQQISRELAEELTASLHDSGEPVWGLDVLPEINRVPGSEQYFRRDAMGLDFMQKTFTARYRKNGVLISVFLSRRDTPAAAGEILNRYAAYARQFGEGLKEITRNGVTITLCDMDGSYDVLFHKGDVVAGVTSVEDREIAVDSAFELWRHLTIPY